MEGKINEVENSEFRNKEISFNMEDLSEPDCPEEHGENVNLNELRTTLKEQKANLFNKMTDILRMETDVILLLAKEFTFIKTKIEKLNCPLAQLEEEIKRVCIGMKNSKQNLGKLIKEIEKYKADKKMALSKVNALNEIKKTKKIMEDNVVHYTNISGYNIKEANMEIVERLVDQNAINLPEDILEDEPELAADVKAVSFHINNLLKQVFTNALKTKDTKSVIRALHVFMRLGSVKEAEHVLRSELVHVFLKDILTEQHLRELNNDLDAMLQEVLLVCYHYFGYVITAIQNEKTLHVFDFGEYSIFPEVCELIKINLSSIAAPGDPKIFHKNFNSCTSFLRKIAEYTLNPNVFLSSVQVTEFMKMFNVDVYFKIRSTQINAIVENTFTRKPDFNTNELLLTKENKLKGEFITFDGKTIQFEMVMSAHLASAIACCYDRNILLQLLTYKFNKLIWNLYMAYEDWLKCVLSDTDSKRNSSEFLGDSTDPSSSSVPQNRVKFENKLAFLMAAFRDQNTLHDEFFPSFLKNPTVTQQNRDICDKVEIIQQLIHSRIDNIICHIYFTLEKVAYGHILNLNQIPRLFRRTNRSHPTNPSPWVNDVFVPLRYFLDTYKKEELAPIYATVVSSFISATNKSIKNNLTNLLISLGATEMSLRRLKIRNNMLESSLTMDEAKIREQLKIDVISYIKEARTLICDTDLEQDFEELTKLSTAT